jgi:hypothetical protein
LLQLRLEQMDPLDPERAKVKASVQDLFQKDHREPAKVKQTARLSVILWKWALPDHQPESAMVLPLS